MRKVCFAILVFFSFKAIAQFSPGNIVVSRVGDGSTGLTNASAQVQLVEYTTAGVATSVMVTLPTTSGGAGSRACTNSGSSTTEGFLTQSYDGRYLVHVGYDAAPGVLSIATSATNPNRTIALIDATGTANTSTSYSESPSNYVRLRVEAGKESCGCDAMDSHGCIGIGHRAGCSRSIEEARSYDVYDGPRTQDGPDLCADFETFP